MKKTKAISNKFFNRRQAVRAVVNQNKNVLLTVPTRAMVRSVFRLELNRDFSRVTKRFKDTSSLTKIFSNLIRGAKDYRLSSTISPVSNRADSPAKVLAFRVVFRDRGKVFREVFRAKVDFLTFPVQAKVRVMDTPEDNLGRVNKVSLADKVPVLAVL